MPITFKARKHQGDLHLTLIGDFDEAAGGVFSREILPKCDRHVVFHMAQIRGMNSPGVKSWIQLLKDLDAKVTFEFQGCPPTYVNYVGLLPVGMFAHRITSLVIPFRCMNCDVTFGPLVETARLEKGEQVAKVPCPNCTETCEPQVHVEEYLHFLQLPGS